MTLISPVEIQAGTLNAMARKMEILEEQIKYITTRFEALDEATTFLNNIQKHVTQLVLANLQTGSTNDNP